MPPTDSPMDRLLNVVAECFTEEVAQRLVNTTLDVEMQTRIEALAAKANEGELSKADELQYREYVEAIDIVATLQAKARKFLAA